ncbi:hypothetical protein QFZ43_004398 [Streptomyces afghaniensis]|nr:hypothetical protein [Streptomyces afghaniensis]
MTTDHSGDSRTLTPPTTAAEISPLRRPWLARWTATSDDEHAVSSERLGPLSPSQYDRRPAANVDALPVRLYASRSSAFTSCI